MVMSPGGLPTLLPRVPDPPGTAQHLLAASLTRVTEGLWHTSSHLQPRACVHTAPAVSRTLQ